MARRTGRRAPAASWGGSREFLNVARGGGGDPEGSFQRSQRWSARGRAGPGHPPPLRVLECSCFPSPTPNSSPHSGRAGGGLRGTGRRQGSGPCLRVALQTRLSLGQPRTGRLWIADWVAAGGCVVGGTCDSRGPCRHRRPCGLRGAGRGSEGHAGAAEASPSKKP